MRHKRRPRHSQLDERAHSGYKRWLLAVSRARSWVFACFLTLSDSAAVRSSSHFFFHAIVCRPFALLVAPFFTSAVAPGAKLSRPRHHALGGTSLAPRRERIAKPATPRPVLRPLGKAQGQRCGTRRHLRRLPRTEHPPQPAGGPRRRSLGAVGSTRRRSARRRTGCVAAAPPAAHDAQDSRWLQDSADSVAWAAHGMPESPHEVPRPG